VAGPGCSTGGSLDCSGFRVFMIGEEGIAFLYLRHAAIGKELDAGHEA
jgi:hypothetical protein